MNSVTDIVPASPVEREVGRLRGLQASGAHEPALAGATALLRDYPSNRDLLMIQAVSLRHLSRVAEALKTLARLEALQPRYSQLHQERGLCFVALKDGPRAIDALLRAVNINPALPMSWRMLAGVYKISGDLRNAETAAAHVATLAALPPEVVTATSLFADGELTPAEEMIRAYLLRHGDHPEAMRLLAKIGMARDVLDDAEVLLEAVMVLAPEHRAARYDYAQCLVQRHKYAQARDQVDTLLALDPANPDYRQVAATVAVGLGENEAAIGLYRGLLADAPGSADLNLWLGHALKTVGQLPEAIEAYRAAATARPDFGDAYWSLANLKTYRFGDEDIARMRAEEAAPTIGLVDRYHLCFALGKALEDKGETAESWLYYERGNALQRSQSRYRPQIIETNTARQIQVCTPAFFAARKGWGAPDADPIFILGLPRAGSTLLEQILSSHSQVEGTMELPNVLALAHKLDGRRRPGEERRYPANLADLTAADLAKFGAAFIADTCIHRKQARPFFIDKMPNNFRHIGLIQLILPNAKIIDARRGAMSCCFSGFKQLFAEGQEFTYGLEEIGHYYADYVRLMDHWDAVLPGRVLRVQYEDVVADLETQVRRLLDFCGLPFEEACLAFHRNDRAVRTASSEQVRKPIYTDGVAQWRHFSPWLDPLRAVLGEGLSTT